MYLEHIKSLKATYKAKKSKSNKDRIQFLDSVVYYCKFIGFDKSKTLTILGIIRNFIPEPGQKFTDCDRADDIDKEYTQKIHDTF